MLHDDLLAQARHLATRERRRPKQASLRRAVSAAYYALFHYLIDDVVRFFESGNAESLANAMLEVLGDAKLRARLVEAGRAYAQANSWSSRKADYLMLVDSLCSA